MILISEQTINFITKTKWKNIFIKEQIKKYSKACDTGGLSELKNLINSKYRDLPGSQISSLDNAIFREFAFNKHNDFRIDNLAIDRSVQTDKISARLTDNIRLDKSFQLDHEIPSSGIKIYTSRIYSIDNLVNKIVILYKVGRSKTPNPLGYLNIFVSVTIDFENKMLCIGHDQTTFKKYSDYSFSEACERIIRNLESNVFPFLNIEISEYNDVMQKEILYNLYKELSMPIERKLVEALPQNTNELIQNLFNALGIELKEKYLQQMHSIIFQDYGDEQSMEFQEGLYNDGWIFRFAFKDGDYTKATSRTEDRSPVYTSPVFWNLKELIASKSKLTEAGYVWAIDKNKLVQARIDVHNRGFCVYLYNSEFDWGEERIEFIREKIKGYIPS